ncbi:hypothetical protein FKM82_022584 [Ascaphus truei]
MSPNLIHFLMELLVFVLTHNYFVYKNKFYLQKRGTVMGAACTPSYANLFLGWWEQKVPQLIRTYMLQAFPFVIKSKVSPQRIPPAQEKLLYGCGVQ